MFRRSRLFAYTCGKEYLWKNLYFGPFLKTDPTIFLYEVGRLLPSEKELLILDIDKLFFTDIAPEIMTEIPGTAVGFLSPKAKVFTPKQIGLYEALLERLELDDYDTCKPHR